MRKKLVTIAFGIFLAGSSIGLIGCGDPIEDYKNSLKPENRTQKQRQFLVNMHAWYGPEVSFSEAKKYIRTQLEGYKDDIAIHYLKKRVEKTGNKESLDDETLIVMNDIIRKVD